MRDVTTLPHIKEAFGVQWNGSYGNWDTNRVPLTTIVLHSTDGFLQASIDRLNTPTTSVSCHYIFDFNGELHSMVPEKLVAYHSGNYPTNQASIGIEFTDNGNNQVTRPDSLYEAGAQLLADLSKAYNIPLDDQHVKLHNEIIATACPGSLDRARLLSRANQILQPAEEALHDYQLKPSVFTSMVTKSSEYDALWEALKLDQSVKANPGSHQVILDNLQAQITQARNVPQSVPVAPAPPATPSTPTPPATPAQPATPSPTDQANTVPAASTSIWRKDIRDVLADVFNALRGDRSN